MIDRILKEKVINNLLQKKKFDQKKVKYLCY